MEWCVVALLCLGTVLLIGLQQLHGWLVLLLGTVLLLRCHKQFAKDFLLVFVALALLGITDIDTDISYKHMIEMGVTLGLAVAIPYVVSRWIYKDHLVRFRFHHGRKWYRVEVAYIFFTALISYFLLPFYLRTSGAYINWAVDPGISNILRLFIGTNALGIWDELFFVSTILGIFRRFLPFGWANIAQSVLFTSFLYELGFTGWGPWMIYPFALLQGYVFQKTDSLLYVITIHLTLDLVLYLALIHAHHPTWMPIFF